MSEDNPFNPKKEPVRINLPPKPIVAPELVPGLKAFRYGAISSQGIEVEGKINAADVPSATQIIKEWNLTPTFVEEDETKDKSEAKADELLAEKEASEGKTEKPSSLGRKIGLGLVAAIGIGGGTYVAGKKLGWWEGQAPEKKIAEAKTNAPAPEKPGFQLPKDTNMSALAEAARGTNAPPKITPTPETIPTNNPLTIEELTAKIKANQAEFEKKLADQGAALSNKLAQVEAKATNAPPVAPPKPALKTHEERIAEIGEKIARRDRGEPVIVTSEEASLWNRDIPRRKALFAAEQAARMAQINANAPQKPPGVREPGRAYGGNIYFAGDQPLRMPQSMTGEMPIKNPFNLSAKMLEQVEEVYENNIEKIFPQNTLQNWRKIKDKSAYEFMNTPENKIRKDHKVLYEHLKNLEKVTNSGPGSGVRKTNESIEGYIDRALKNAAAINKLEEVKLK